MKQPRRGPSRNARSAPNTAPLTSPLTSPQFALCDVPQVLEHSTRRLEDFEQCAATVPGILVKLFRVDDSNSTLWIVGSPHAKKWIPRKMEGTRTANATTKANANDRTKASHPAKGRPSSAHEAKAQLNSDKAVTQKKLGSRARGAKKATEQQVHEDESESDDVNSEPEGEEDEGGSEDEDEEDEDEDDEDEEDEDEEDEDEEDEDEEEEEEEEDDAGEGNDAREQDAGKDDAGEENAGKKDAGDEDAGDEDAGDEDAGEEIAGHEDAGEEIAGHEDAGEEGDGNAAKEDGEEEEDVGGEDAGEEEEDAGEEEKDAGEEEEDAGEEEKDAGEEEGDAGEEEGDAGEDMNEDLDDSEEGKDLEEGPEKDAVMDKENGHDLEEQDDDGHNEPSNQAETAEADKEEDEECGSEEDLAEDPRDKRQQEAEGQQEAQREFNGDGEETTSDKAQMHNETTGDDGAIQVAQRKEHEDDGDKGSVGVHGEVQEDREFVEQRVAANHPSGAWRSWAPGHADGREEETRGTVPEGGEGTIEANDGSGEGKRKRDLEGDGVIGISTLEEHPNKRKKNTRGDESDADMEDSFESGMETPPRPRTPSRMSPTLSPGSTIKIVRQPSVVPGLQDTENAVWEAAQRDAIFTSLSEAHQKNLLSTALCLGSEEGIEELRCFVSNARIDGKQGRKALMSDFNNTTLDHDARSQIANNSPDPESRYLAHVSKLYRRLDDLRKNETLVIITKRASLATLAQCRESLVPKGVGGNRAKDANLKLFRAIFPQHATVEKPEDGATNFAASRDWSRLRHRLHEGRAWLEVRERFGGLGVFLALPPQCVPDSHVSKIPARNFAILLRLFDVAWRALDDRTRRTMNALVSFAIEKRPLPETTLALERSEAGVGAAKAGLSPMFVGWTASELGVEWSVDSVANPSRGRRLEGKLDTPQTICTTTAGTDREKVVAITESSMRNETTLAVDGGLFENVDFDEPLSQQI